MMFLKKTNKRRMPLFLVFARYWKCRILRVFVSYLNLLLSVLDWVSHHSCRLRVTILYVLNPSGTLSDQSIRGVDDSLFGWNRIVISRDGSASKSKRKSPSKVRNTGECVFVVTGETKENCSSREWIIVFYLWFCNWSMKITKWRIVGPNRRLASSMKLITFLFR